MNSLPESIYGCSIIIGLGNTETYSIAKKQEMWDLWIRYKNNCLKQDERVTNILKTTYPLDNYKMETTRQKWGCIDDIQSLHEDITLFDKKNIYSPIEVIAEVFGFPPFKWCEYMKSKGFLVTLYFVNLNGKYSRKGKCGLSFYNMNYTTKQFHKIPKINEEDFRKLYQRGKRYNNLNKMVKYSVQFYKDRGICVGLCDLLDLWGSGPHETAITNFTKIDSFFKMDQLEENLSNGKLTEGEYIVECKKIKDLYDSIIQS